MEGGKKSVDGKKATDVVLEVGECWVYPFGAV